MTVKYNVVARHNPRDIAAPPKYYPSVVSSGEVTIQQLAEKIADISTVSSIDVVAVLEAFVQLVPRELTEGNIVRLGDLGSFWLRVKSDGSVTPEEVSASNVNKILPKFTPSKRFKKVLNNTDFEKKSS